MYYNQGEKRACTLNCMLTEYIRQPKQDTHINIILVHLI